MRLVGAPGSGRTTTLDEIVHTLVSRGIRVLRAGGGGGGDGLRGQLLGQLGVLSATDDRRPHRVADAIRAKLLADPMTVLALDDWDLGDELSVQLLSTVCEQARCIRVMGIGLGSAHKPTWPEVSLTMPPLRYADVKRLVGDVLGAPAATSLTARILGKSGGIPELVVAIADSARVTGLIAQRDGRWHLAAPSLWNEHLRPFVEWRLRGLSDAELSAARLAAVLGVQSPQRTGLQDQPGYVGLIRRGLIRAVRTEGRMPVASLWPPLIGEMLARHEMPRASTADEMPGPGLLLPPSSEIGSGGSPAVEAVTVAGYFMQETSRAQRELVAWEDAKSPKHATAYLLRATGSSVERSDIERVFSQTHLGGAPPLETLEFVVQHAEWLAFDRGDLAGALERLRDLGEAAPDSRAGAELAACFLTSMLERVSPDDIGRLDIEAAHDTTGAVKIVKALLVLFGGDVTAARRELPESASGLYGEFLLPFVEALVTALEGAPWVAYHRAAEIRERALVARDRLGYVGASYVSAFAASAAGCPQASEHVVSSGLSLARVSMVARPLFGCLLNIHAFDAIRSGRDSEALLHDALAYAGDPGPLYGMGTDLTSCLVAPGLTPAEVDEQLAVVVRTRMDRGYLTAAASCAVFAGTLCAGPALAREAAALLDRVTIPLFDRALRASAAASVGDVSALARLADETPRGDSALVTQTLDAARRRAETEGDRRLVDALAAIIDRTAGVSRLPAAVIDSSMPAQRLTSRELEIATLAGHLRNRDISHRLGISIRTVENHISNALRKTGMRSRSDLAQLVSEAR
ncbi:LuxR C-terminal-related transcriptional regulator [Microbacterium sp. BWT-B31]|uniref:helix-turn-helix transcriptional regulator n=1 Tax=Microbacterium sp. BWT-B31 TaxID=3232072 RepID=UPI003529BEC9